MLAVLGLTGPWEWIIVLVVILIMFGAGKLPQVLGQMGKGVKAFKDGMNDKDDDLLEAKTNTDGQKEKVTDVNEVRKI